MFWSWCLCGVGGSPSSCPLAENGDGSAAGPVQMWGRCPGDAQARGGSGMDGILKKIADSAPGSSWLLPFQGPRKMTLLPLTQR